MNLYNHLGLYRLILIRSYTYSGITLMVDLSLFGSTRRYYKLILVLRILYLFYEVYMVLRDLYGSYGSYSCAKVPVGTMSRNRSGSYHIQGQIRYKVRPNFYRYGH